ncbi:MAG: glutamine--fructose-6-phosphate transaminase (isomerizing) [Bacteroidetes bacterium]|uniref:Glutamine--fructose-6-phosphate aminotransferase [isomerizing] n=1 Tax=Candidatus Enterocola intestinipullorum TaxID=2840783 RepID=A0A9D9EHX5_9BACT|nr:glutamine--fructose-6-phosphate transaminase (isomerizing) [Candidatus Enterocola intestinipullorum]
MCGIVGYIGQRQAYPILIKGLHRLEYRGYDSAGIALINPAGELGVFKTKGKVADLEALVANRDVSGTVGIGHTRWATHGEPNDANAHPHYSQTKNLALIHNGIIENYAVIKNELKGHGYNFRSETDTEVLVQFIEYVKSSGNLDLFHAVQVALSQVVGAYAIAVIDKNNPDCIVAARKSSPLVIGIGEGEYFLGSDASPIIEYTDQVVYLEDEQVALISRSHGLDVRNLSDVEQTPEVKTLQLSLSQLEKGGYPHFMLKEINEQPDTLVNCISGRIDPAGTDVILSGVINNKEKFLNAKRIIMVACGTSWHAGMIGKYLIEDLCRIPVDVEYASEFRYRNPVLGKGDIVIAISQSGETADTLAAIQEARKAGAFVYGICNAVGSSIARATHSGSYIHVGPEIGVASTKAFTGQVMVLSMLALTLGKLKGTIKKGEYRDLIKDLISIPTKMKQVLLLDPLIDEMSKIFTYAHNFLYLGRGYNYPAAMEGALKLKEISYIHAEGYPAAEMKHGPIALVDAEMPVVVLATADRIYEKTVSNIQEIKARKGKVIAVVTEGDTVASSLADYVIAVPPTNERFTALVTAIPLQLLAYHIAVNKGKDVDQPRNLAKSVTVE